MAAHFKWYPASEEVVVPWNARYSFPSQANKASKLTPRIPPKNGSVFQPGNVIRLEFPAQGFVNPINTTLEFDVTLQSFGTSGGEAVRFQNNIQSIFNRVRLLYGATPLEDIINYNVIVRSLTEWTATNQLGSMDQTSVSEGIGGVVWGADGSGDNSVQGLVNVRQNYIQGIDLTNNVLAVGALNGGQGAGAVPNKLNTSSLPNQGTYYCTRRYQVNLALGLLTQDKLLPVKFMASQLAIELTLEQPASCIFAYYALASGLSPTYGVFNVNLIPEVLEFDASYDAMFLRGLEDGGVPIKFSSWHTFISNIGNQSNANVIVQERSRSVKALFALQRRNPAALSTDTGASFFSTAGYTSGGTSMQNYQFRIGARYFPASPVQLSTNIGTSNTNGGAEAMVELQKALNIVGDYRLSSSINSNRWAIPASENVVHISAGNPVDGPGTALTQLNELDYACTIPSWTVDGAPNYNLVKQPQYGVNNNGNAFAGNLGSACYASAIDLETSNGIEISGLNAEEQSDIAFIANWSAPQQTNFTLEVYSYYDAMIILKPNNVIELIQ